MRNLNLIDHQCQVTGGSLPKGAKLCIDPVTQCTYAIHTRGIDTLTQDPQEPQCFPPIVWKDHGITTARVVSGECVCGGGGGAGTVCVVTAEGLVITASTTDQQVEVVGEVAEGITAANWSPDEEVIALATPSNKLILMTANFDPIAETPLADGTPDRPMVALGWGRKETQFHGSEGKRAAVARTAKRGAPFWDDGAARISWRGDGELVAVGYLSETGERRIVVLNREGTIQAVSEVIDGLESPLAWKPSGNVIASTQTSGTKHEVAFVEKNGLKHGSFTLPFESGCMEVVELAWSPDSYVLAIWFRHLRKEGGKEKEEEDVVQLWTTGNYHWYLKKEIRLREGGITLRWEEKSPPLLTLHILTTTHHHHLTYLPHTTHTHGQSAQDPASVAVVDGTALLMTPFRHITVPPPMSAFKVIFPHPINSLAVCLSDSSADCPVDDSGFLEGCEDIGIGPSAMLVQHGDHQVTVLAPVPHDQPLSAHGCQVVMGAAGGNGFKASVQPPGVFGQYSVDWPSDLTPRPAATSDIYHWTWPRKDTIFGVFGFESACYVVVFEFAVDSSCFSASSVIPAEDWVVAVSAVPSMAILQLANGGVVKLDFETCSLEPFVLDGREVRFPDTCERLCLLPPLDGGQPITPLGLTSRGRLYLGHKQILGNCTSIHLHTHHLLATTTAHTLIAVPLTTSALAAVDKVVDSAGVRRIERGARIVCGVAQDTRVVLQMPRGNLEVVNPRPLTVHSLARLLDSLRFGDALELARKHRVDTNLLYDHDPRQFLASVEQFVRSVNDAQKMDVFLATLSESDTSATTYSFHYHDRISAASTTPTTPTTAGKIQAICQATREAMFSIDKGKYGLPILTSLVKEGQMEMALREVRESHQSEDGLRHLLCLTEAEELYRVALGTYDLALALMVAERSTKDPKEYLPELNSLRELDEKTRRFRINVLLQRFDLALSDLDDSATHAQEAVELIKAKRLYPLALRIIPAQTKLKVTVCELYGRYLLEKGLHAEAALMLGRAGQHRMAMEAHRSAGNWEMAFIMATKLGLAKETMAEFCEEVADQLKRDGRFSEAAWVYEEHLAKEEEAIECLALAGRWTDAMRLAYKHGREDLVHTEVEPAVLKQAEDTRTDIEETRGLISTRVERLALVRLAKETQGNALPGVNEEVPLDSDLYSDASTVTGISRNQSGTTHTSRSHRSSKSRRKLERKKYSIKEGSAQEDLGLVSSLHQTYTSLTKRAEEMSALCIALVTLSHDTKAFEIQNAFSDLLKLAETKRTQIWPTVQEQEFGPDMSAEKVVQQVTLGSKGQRSWVLERMSELDPHLRLPPALPKDTWRLTLLMDVCKK